MKSALLPVFVLVLSATAACGDDAATGTGDGDVGSGGGSGDVGQPDGGGDDIDGAEADAAEDAAVDSATDSATDVAVDSTAQVDTTDPDVAPDGVDDVAVQDTTTGADGGETFADPYADGPYRIEEVAVTVPLSDDTTASATVFIPDFRADAPFPWVVLSHGFQLQGSQFFSYARRLATHGIAVIVPSYGDNLFAARTHVELANDVITIIDWAVEQTSQPGAFQGAFDVERIGLAGHSRGGKQSIFAATLDDRIDAVFGMDPVDSGPPGSRDVVAFPSVAPEMMGDLTIPSGYIGTGRGGSGIPPCAPTDNNYAQYFAASPSPSYSWLIPGAGHNDFTDTCTDWIICNACRGGDDPDFTRTFTRATMVAFFEVYLAGDPLYEPWVNGAAVTSLAETEVITFSER